MSGGRAPDTRQPHCPSPRARPSSNTCAALVTGAHMSLTGSGSIKIFSKFFKITHIIHLFLFILSIKVLQSLTSPGPKRTDALAAHLALQWHACMHCVCLAAEVSPTESLFEHILACPSTETLHAGTGCTKICWIAFKTSVVCPSAE